MIELPYGVGVRIDAENAAIIQSHLMPAPVKIEPPRVRVDFNGDASLGAGFQNSVDVDFISGAPGELTPGHMAQDGRIRIFNRL